MSLIEPELQSLASLGLDSSTQAASPTGLLTKTEAQASAMQLDIDPPPESGETGWFLNGEEENRQSPVTPAVEALHDPHELAQQLSTYHEDRLLPPDHPDVVALLTYKAALEGQYARGLRDLQALYQDTSRAHLGVGVDVVGQDGPNRESQTMTSEGSTHLQERNPANSVLDTDPSTFPETTKPPSLSFHRPSRASSIDSDSSDPPTPIPPLPPCPEIDWSKYFVSGKGLEELHQRILSRKIAKCPPTETTQEH